MSINLPPALSPRSQRQAGADVNALPAMCCLVDGISLHAGVAVPARDRDRLERLCRYVARPPVCSVSRMFEAWPQL
ncbi:MAG TPA: hypothetical protein VKA63_02830 [Candidatus Krumholzibacteria bacterium]|nr:hypothetical protein [Candidatus Krumholzibacteria bacterium]